MENNNLESAMATKKKSKSKVIIIISLIVLILIVTAIVLTLKLFIPMHTYNDAKGAIKSGEYERAYELLKECDDYKDSEDLLKNFKSHYKTSERTNYDEQNNITSTTTFNYDENGNEIRRITRDGEGNITADWTSKYEYNPDGTKDSCTVYDENGDLVIVVKYEYQYNKDGNLVVASTTNIGDYVDHMSSVYDKEGNLIHKTWIEGKFNVYYEYDEYGNITRSYEQEESGFIGVQGQIRNEHKYDIKYNYDELDNVVSAYSYDINGKYKVKYSDYFMVYIED